MASHVIIRLQNLPLDARSVDIRKFFENLVIPDGGVHIIGGERGDAFIAFQSDEDARLAMQRDSHFLCNSRVRLQLSSKTEMQNVIAASRNQQPASLSPTLLKPNKESSSNLSKSANPQDLLSSLTKLITSANKEPSSTNDILKDILLKTSSVKKAEEPTSTNISLNQIMGLINQTKTETNSGNQSWSAGNNDEANEDESTNSNSNKNYQPNKYNNFVPNKRKFDDSNNNNNNNNGMQYKKTFTPNNNNKYNNDFNNSNNNNGPKPPMNKLDPIIKVKNFKNNASYKDIRTFLQGIQIEHDGIKLISDSRGNRNGCAFVKLMTITDLKKALCRNGQFYENNIIQVFQSSDSEFEAGYFFDDDSNNKFNKNKPSFQNNTNSNPRFNKNFQSDNSNFNNKPIYKPNYNNQNDNSGLYLKIYGLPASFNSDDLKSMFNNVNFVSIATSVPTPITSTSINSDGQQEQTTVLKAKKICQVERQIDLERALTRQNERVGKSKLQIFQISKSEYDRELGAMQNKTEDMNENENAGDEEQANVELTDDLFVFMSGVPFSAKEYDVRNFFQNINVAELHNIFGAETLKPTGEWCCQFLNKTDRDRALEKDDQFFRNRVIKIKTLTYAEYQQYVLAQSKLKQEMMSKRGGGFNNNNNRNFNDENNGEDNSNGQQDEDNSNNNDNRGFNKFNKSNFNNGFQKKFQNKPNFNSNNSRSPNMNENSNEAKRKPYENNTQSANSNSGSKRIKTSNDANAPSIIDLPPLPPELQKFRNSLVLLSNVSYDASREDILEFMKTFSPLEKTLKIRYNDLGEPTGDAIIACKTSEEANRACRELNGTEFMGLKVKTALVSP